MNKAWVFLIAIPVYAAGLLPNRYLVELESESVSEHVTRIAGPGQGAHLLRGEDATQHRARVRAEQARAGARIQEAGGKVVGALENVFNALIVQIPDAQAARLQGIAGVRKVHPVREFHLLLDHALRLHRVPEAWSQGQFNQAGAGIKIAIIDTGIDISHPGFQAGSLPVPAGYPLADNNAGFAFTNQKVIVARSYADLFDNFDPDPTPRDHVGHGTATAMAAAGVLTSGPLATISGVAPQAYIGSYKVFGTPGINDSASEAAILKAIDDAVADGMDVISMSLGSDLSTRLADDPEVQSLENAAALGIVVVVAAGNNGPDPGTVGSPAVAPSVIAVGASNNDRMFAASVLTPLGKPILALPGSGVNSPTSISGPLMDVSKLDGGGLACTALPARSLRAAIALIARGTCLFETKLNNVAASGAAGAIVYNYLDQPGPIVMNVGSATLPAEMISYADAQALAKRPAHRQKVVLRFTLGPISIDPASLAAFSAEGPNVDLSIKPDMVAVGTHMYTAAETTDPNGQIYSPDGYAVEEGTSFSTPLVAGAAALLKAARPGLTAAQYRSLLINSAAPASLVPGMPARAQQAGTGNLDALASLSATAAAAPVSLSFGAGPGDVTAAQTLTVWNVGASADTFTILAHPRGGGPVPRLPYSSIHLDAGASVRVPVSFSGTALAPGAYEGFLAIQGSNSAVVTRVPYWYAVPSGQAHFITVLANIGTARTGTRISDAALFRVSDESGLPVPGVQLQVTAVSGGGQVTSMHSRDAYVPNAFGFNIHVSAQPGPNVFRIQAGEIIKDVTILAQ